MSVFAITRDHLDVHKVVRETACTVYYFNRAGDDLPQHHRSRNSFYPWRGSQEQALAMVNKIKAARGEHRRRVRAADVWLGVRVNEIFCEATP